MQKVAGLVLQPLKPDLIHNEIGNILDEKNMRWRDYN